MADKDLGYTEPIKCGHCGNTGIMKVVYNHLEKEMMYPDPLDGSPYLEWQVHELCICEVCDGFVFSRAAEDGRGILYPAPYEASWYYPKPVKITFDEAQKVRHSSANAYAGMLGRLLEAICDDRGAKGDDLYKRLKDLADRGVIPAQLGQLAQRLRELRNVGAHAKEGELTAAHVPILDNMTRALLDYLYAVPSYLEEAEKQLDELRQKKQQPK